MATLKTIAQDLNVSVSLVSKVLNDRLGTTGVNAKTQQTIRERAKQLNYRPHRTASSLRSGRQGVLGVLVHHAGAAGSAIVEDFLRGVVAGLDESHGRMWLMFYQTDEDFQKYVPYLQKSEIDGLILGGVMHEQLIDQLREIRSRLPIVTVHDRELDPSIPNLGVDQTRMVQRSVEHLLDRGCKRLLMVGPRGERHRGFVEACENRGLVQREGYGLCVTDDYEYASGTIAAEHFTGGAAYDGVVAFSDQLALSVINRLFAMGLRIPEQVRIIGLDNSPACDSAIVPLTSVSEHYEERGHEAVTLINQLLDGQPIKSVLFPPELFPREST